jgi:hypothetical protein
VAERLELARDVLDKLLVDKHGRPLGRVDGVLLHLRRDKPPRVGEIEVGVYTMLRRIGNPFGKWLAAIVKRVSPVPLDSVRLPFDHFTRKSNRIEMTLDGEMDDRLIPGEKWLRDHIVKRLPGGHK